MENNKRKTYLVVVVCLVLLALLCMFGPFDRTSPAWHKVVALAAVTVVTFPLAQRGETEKKFGMIKILEYLLLVTGVLVYFSALSGEPTETVTNELTLAFAKLCDIGVFLWSGAVGLYLTFIGLEAIKSGRKGLPLNILGAVVCLGSLLLSYLPFFAENRELALQLMGAPYLLSTLGFFLLSRMEIYGHI